MNKALSFYEHYRTTDFFQDESFIDSVRHPTADSDQYWQALAQQYPDRRPYLEEARTWILLLVNQPVSQPVLSEPAAWAQLIDAVYRKEAYQQRYIVPLRRIGQWTARAAAVALLLLAGNELRQYGRHDVETAYGTRREITLPDESEVVLNGNSRIEYARTWRSDKPREIWAEGEVFFTVKHVALKNRIQQADSFRVHTNGLNLTVLGTKFNVRTRRQKTEIALVEGRLKIEKPGQFVRYLRAGESVGYDAATAQLRPLTRPAQAGRAWLNQELEFTGYTLREVLTLLEDTYGYQITVNTPDLLDRKLTGTVPAANPEDVLFVIGKVFNVTIDKQDNRITINPN